MIWLLQHIFGCVHKRTSFPLSPRQNRPAAAKPTGTYVVCLECGQEFPYDWSHLGTVSK